MGEAEAGSRGTSASGWRRVIFHVDMDAFFVSVEELFDPTLKGKPVVVGGKGDERGVVSAASYAARKYGIHSAMPLRTAYQKCPHAIFLDGHRDRYSEYSRKVRAVLESFSPVLEMASIDEAYLDMTGTGRLYGPPLRAAHLLHERIGKETRLNCSVGVAGSRLVAKISSDLAKPNGIFLVLPGQEAATLASLEVGRIPGVGKVMQESLRELGIRRVGDLRLVDEDLLRRRFGKWGMALGGKARGEDAGGWFDSSIGADEDPKSVSHEHTFNQDTADAATLEAILARMAEMVGRRLRELGLHARTIQLKLRDQRFSTITRARTLEQRTNLDVEIFQEARALFRQNWKPGTKVRLIGVQASSLDASEGQLALLDHQRHQRLQQALSAADKLRAKYGEDTVSLAASMKGRFRERVHDAMQGSGSASTPSPQRAADADAGPES
ncbi:MAG: DNA polymerase IV [Bryobacterales bacterium]|jgi:DNA polymerase-4|nr:DNA polymerase IV [Bryobacterales bacterium]